VNLLEDEPLGKTAAGGRLVAPAESSSAHIGALINLIDRSKFRPELSRYASIDRSFHSAFAFSVCVRSIRLLSVFTIVDASPQAQLSSQRGVARFKAFTLLKNGKKRSERIQTD
jgi:hypothetical protein